MTVYGLGWEKAFSRGKHNWPLFRFMVQQEVSHCSLHCVKVHQHVQRFGSGGWVCNMLRNSLPQKCTGVSRWLVTRHLEGPPLVCKKIFPDHLKCPSSKECISMNSRALINCSQHEYSWLKSIPRQKALFRRYATQVRWKGLGESSAINSQLNMSLSKCSSTAAREDLACSFSAASVWTGILERAGIRHVWISMTLLTEYVRIPQAAKEMKIRNYTTFKGPRSPREYTASGYCPVWLQRCRSLLPCASLPETAFPLVATWMLISQTRNLVF